MILSVWSRLAAARLGAWQSSQMSSILLRSATRALSVMVRIGMDSGVPARRVSWATVPYVMFVETLCVSGMPGPFSC